MPSIIWSRGDGSGFDRCVFEPAFGGHRLAGTSLLAVSGDPIEIRYSMVADSAFRVHTIGAHVQGPDGDRRLALATSGNGVWTSSGSPVKDLDGIADVTLAWTPASTTMLIRRLALDIGATATTTAATIHFPERNITRKDVEVERTGEGSYRMAAGALTESLEVDEHGLVLNGVGDWIALTRR